MLEFARYEGRRRLRGSVALAAGLGALTALYVAMYPGIAAEVDLDAYVAAIPEALREAFGVVSLGTIEGFLAVELYGFAWVLLLGLYFAYAAASLVADDVEHGRMEVTLSLPVSRTRVVVEKFLSLSVPVAVLNAVVAAVAYASTVLVDDPVPLVDLAAVHLLSVPYLFACAGIGLVASVAFDRAGVAQRVALAVVFGLFLVESLLSNTGYAEAGAVAPMRYYDPSAVLVGGRYDLVGAGVLLAATLGLLATSVLLFRRTDVN